MTAIDDSRAYWNKLADKYQAGTRISLDDFHFGPLLPGDRELRVLPAKLDGARCLEIGCGAAQNSIHLAARGAECVALDVSPHQLDHARRLAGERGVAIDLLCCPMEQMPVSRLGTFDLVHATYSVDFSAAPESVVRDAARMVRPGGQFVLTVGHPLFAWEWVDLAEEGGGLFVPDYFSPPGDSRLSDAGKPISAQTYPVSRVVEWLNGAGLVLHRLLEPRALPVDTMDEKEVTERVPYDSQRWRALLPKLSHVPVVAIYAASRPAAA